MSIVAIMLGRLEMDAEECVSAYSNLTKLIWRSQSVTPTRLRRVTTETEETILDSVRHIVEETIDVAQPFRDDKQRRCRT